MRGLVCLGEHGGARLSQALNRVPGCLPNAHHHPRLRAEEPRRLLLDPLEQNAVCEEYATDSDTQVPSTHVCEDVRRREERVNPVQLVRLGGSSFGLSQVSKYCQNVARSHWQDRSASVATMTKNKRTYEGCR